MVGIGSHPKPVRLQFDLTNHSAETAFPSKFLFVSTEVYDFNTSFEENRTLPPILSSRHHKPALSWTNSPTMSLRAAPLVSPSQRMSLSLSLGPDQRPPILHLAFLEAWDLHFQNTIPHLLHRDMVPAFALVAFRTAVASCLYFLSTPSSSASISTEDSKSHFAAQCLVSSKVLVSSHPMQSETPSIQLAAMC